MSHQMFAWIRLAYDHFVNFFLQDLRIDSPASPLQNGVHFTASNGFRDKKKAKNGVAVRCQCYKQSFFILEPF